MWRIPVVICIALVLTACVFRRQRDYALSDGRLKRCSFTPNCVSSERRSLPFISWVSPLAFDDSPTAAWKRAREAVEGLGGNVQKDDGVYMWATFHSKVFRFVDDVELRMDEEHRVIHIRSASRLGITDFGVNPWRVWRLRARFDSE